MVPPDLYRSEAFAEDLPAGGYEPLALRPARLPMAPARRPGGLLNALRAAWAPRGPRVMRREHDGTVQLA